jgi:hypothetical protein
MTMDVTCVAVGVGCGCVSRLGGKIHACPSRMDNLGKFGDSENIEIP